MTGNASLAEFARAHLESIREFYDRSERGAGPFSLTYRKVIARQLLYIIPEKASVLEIGCGAGDLLTLLPNRQIAGIDLSDKQIARCREKLPQGMFYRMAGEELNLSHTYDYIIISDTLNLAADVQALLEKLRAVSHERTRIIINFYSHLWRPIIYLGELPGCKERQPANNWLTPQDVRNFLALSSWQQVKRWNTLVFPLPIPVIERAINRWLAPLLQPLCLVNFVLARQAPQLNRREYTVSVVIPARNESGNIEAAVLRTPDMGLGTEIIFVEGGSSDNTWEEIQRVQRIYPNRKIQILRQPGKGKGDAVRTGFAAAQGDLLMILDADLTMPPEELPKFYNAIASGEADFANGSRLVYPMRDGAMQFLNMCANKVFGFLFSWMLGQPLKDTLCGTKVCSRVDYMRILENRHYFGDFDPFGDFDLLFGASKLGLKIADIPIRYQERTYGETNIRRWKHGWLLLRMVLFAARKVRFI